METRASAGEFDGLTPQQLQRSFNQLVDLLPTSSVGKSDDEPLFSKAALEKHLTRIKQRAGSELQTAGFVKMRELLQYAAVSDFFRDYLLSLYRQLQTEGVSKGSIEFEHFKLITTYDPNPFGDDDTSIEEKYLRNIAMPNGLVSGMGKLKFSPNLQEDAMGGMFNPERASDFEGRAYLLELSALLSTYAEAPRASRVFEFSKDGIEKMTEWRGQIMQVHKKIGLIGRII